jgi:hypothetical protein
MWIRNTGPAISIRRTVFYAGLAIKNPPKKTHPKKPKKTHLKKPTKNVFFVSFLIFNFYENNTNFSL